MFCSVLVTTVLLPLMTVFVLKHWLHLEVSFQSWLLIFSFVVVVGNACDVVRFDTLTRPISELNESVRVFLEETSTVRFRVKPYPNDTAKCHNEVGPAFSAWDQMAEDLKRTDEHRSAFIANLSHELKTPVLPLLVVICGWWKIRWSDQKRINVNLQSESLRLSRYAMDCWHSRDGARFLNKEKSVPPGRTAFACRDFDYGSGSKKRLTTFGSGRSLCGDGSDLSMQEMLDESAW